MKAKPKFKIGDLVFLKSAVETAHLGFTMPRAMTITEQIIQICYGGTQNAYLTYPTDGRPIPEIALIPADDPLVMEAVKRRDKTTWGVLFDQTTKERVKDGDSV